MLSPGLGVKCGVWNQSMNGDIPSCDPLERARLWGQSKRDKHPGGPWRPWVNNIAFAGGLPWQGQLLEGRLWAEEGEPSVPLQGTSLPPKGPPWVWEWHLVIVSFLEMLRVTFQTTGNYFPFLFLFCFVLMSLLSFPKNLMQGVFDGVFWTFHCFSETESRGSRQGGGQWLIVETFSVRKIHLSTKCTT